MPEEATAKVGRPSSFKPEYVEQARKLCQLGATDRELADFFDVDEATVHRWKQSHPEFCDSTKMGKGPADDRVEASLYRRATGYSYDSEEIFTYEGQPVRVPCVKHVPPDTTACIFWLKNRRRDQWRDRFDHNVKPAGDLSKMTDDELTESIRRLQTVLANGSNGAAGEDAGTAKPTNGSSVH